ARPAGGLWSGSPRISRRGLGGRRIGRRRRTRGGRGARLDRPVRSGPTASSDDHGDASGPGGQRLGESVAHPRWPRDAPRRPGGAVSTAALGSLAEADEPGTAHEAARLLTSDSSAAVRASAVRALAQAPAETRAWALSSALADPDPDVRAIAVEILPRDAPGA